MYNRNKSTSLQWFQHTSISRINHRSPFLNFQHNYYIFVIVRVCCQFWSASFALPSQVDFTNYHCQKESSYRPTDDHFESNICKTQRRDLYETKTNSTPTGTLSTWASLQQKLWIWSSWAQIIQFYPSHCQWCSFAYRICTLIVLNFRMG